MKKLCLCVFLVLLTASCSQPADEKSTPTFTFSDISDLEFWFASGVGGWGTVVNIAPDGSFTGYYEDTNLGEYGEDYPNGTKYECLFSGQFSELTKIGEHEYSIECQSLTVDGTVGNEEIIDGIKVITSEPYGFSDANEFALYLPGKKTSELPQAFLDWVSMPRAIDLETVETLDFYGLYNISGEQGFSAN